jgi:hypothetical protein
MHDMLLAKLVQPFPWQQQNHVRRDRGEPKGDLASFSVSASDERKSKLPVTVHFSHGLLMPVCSSMELLEFLMISLPHQNIQEIII